MLLPALLFLASVGSSNAYWLMAMKNNLVSERVDPIVNPGGLSSHTHTVVGGSNFGPTVSTASLRQSNCSSVPILEDLSVYWFPTLYFEWANGSFSSVGVSVVIYYLFSNTPGYTTAFPDDFRMISGTPTLRTLNASSYAQQAVGFRCLDYSNQYNQVTRELPARQCASGLRSEINFPSCWDGKNTDSSDHKSHVAFLSTGPDSGTCTDPAYPVTLPRIFMEGYLDVGPWYQYINQAKNTTQPFVYAMGDPFGYGYHADFVNGWQSGFLQGAVDKCNCDKNGDMSCCVNAGVFTKTTDQCFINPSVNETVLGTLSALPGNNPVSYGPPSGGQLNLASLSSSSTISLPSSTPSTGSSCPQKKREGSALHKKMVRRSSSYF